MKDKKYQQFSVGRAGSGQVDLATGGLTYAHENTNGGASVMPINIAHIYSTKNAIENSQTSYGKGFTMNLQQKLLSKPDDETKWKYIDGGGEEHKFKERYFYCGASNQKVFSDYQLADIVVGQDGRLHSVADPSLELFVEIKTRSGFSLLTELKGFVGRDKLETRNQELVSLENEINELNRSILDMNAMLAEYRKYETVYSINPSLPATGNNAFTLDSLIARQRALEEYALRLEELSLGYQDGSAKYLRSQLLSFTRDLNQHLQSTNSAQQNSVSSTSFDLENLSWNNTKKLTFIADASGYPNQQQMLSDRRVLHDRKAVYDAAEETRMKAQYALQKDVVEKIKIAYEKMLREKQFTLTRLNVQLPVNYVVDENSVALGFNKAGDLVAIIDSYDNQVSIVYMDGRIDSVVETDGKEIHFEYLPNGKLHAIIDFEDRRTMYEYGQGSESDLLKRILYPNGDCTDFGYIAALLTSITSPSGIGVVLGYNDNKVVAITDKAAVDRTTSIAYQTTQTVVTDERTRATATYIFADAEKEWMIGETHNADGQSRYVTYGRDQDREVFEYVLEQESFIAGITHNAGLSIMQLQNLSANVQGDERVSWTYRDLENRKVCREYASPKTDNNITQTSNREFVYDNDDNLIEEIVYTQTTNKADRVSMVRYEYNKQHKLIRSIATNNIDTVGIVTETLYDVKGNVVRTQSYHRSNPSAKIIEEKEIAENGQITAELDERGNKTVLKYEHDTNILSGKVDANGGETSIGRDPHADEILSISSSVRDGEANTNKFEYDKGLLKSLTGGNTSIEYRYDEFGRRTGININGSNHVVHSYDDDANSTKSIFANGNGYESLADEFGKVNSVRYYQGDVWITHITNEYDARNRLSRTEDHITGEVKEFVYDKFDNVINQTGAVSVASIFDIDGKVEQTTLGYQDNNYTYQYGYNEELQLESVTLPIPTNSIERVEQDKLGRVVKLDTIAGTRELSHIQVGERATGLIAAETHKDKQGNFSKTRYIYDKNGNITETREAGRLRVRYIYDALNRLVREDNVALNKTKTFEYDVNGNIINKGSQDFTLDNELSSDAVDTVYTYNGDALQSIRKQDSVLNFAYDVLGNPTTYLGVSIQWDRVRNLASVNNGETKFEYDANNLRICKKSNTVHSKYFYNGSQLIAEKRSIKSSNLHVGDHLTPGYAYTQDKIITYLYGVDGITGFMVEQPGAEIKVYSYRKNIMGDVLAVYDDNGIVAIYTYDAWGNHTVNNLTVDNIGNFNAIRYRGYYYDPETGFYYLKSRYYDPQIGRFINIDTIDAVDPNSINGLNLYAYCGNNPVMNVDENGQGFFKWLFKSTIGKIIVGLTVIIVGAVVTALTAGTGVGFFAAFGAALLSSAVQVGISMAVSVVVGGFVSLAGGGGFFDHIGKSLVNGFMWGGIFSGGAQILSGGFKFLANIGVPTGKTGGILKSGILSPDRVRNTKEIAQIAAKGQKFFDYGGTILKITKYVHLDVSTKSFLHLAFFSFKHISIGNILAGIIGGTR